MYKFPPKNTKPKNRFSDDVKTGFGFAKLAGFTGFGQNRFSLPRRQQRK